MQNKIIIIAIFCSSILLGLAYFLLFSNGQIEKLASKGDVLAQPKTASVLLTPTGFDPQILTIDSGTVVTFSNKSNNSYWLISGSANPLEGFGAAISPGQSYSFVFDQVGEWPYSEQTY